MPVELSLEQMSLSEKLQLMEALWDHLSRRPANLPSPAWHGEVLAECQRRAESGEGVFSDWETAKENIRRRVA